MKKQIFETGKKCMLVDEQGKVISLVKIDSYNEEEKMYNISKVEFFFRIEENQVSPKAYMEIPKKVQEKFLCDYIEFKNEL